MIEHILEFISSLNPFYIYIMLFFFSFIENVFPPSPSDLVVAISGSLIMSHSIYYMPTLMFTCAGSIIGFWTLFYIGSQLDKKVIRAGKIKFISVDALFKMENWFLKYGYFVILANRFLPGMRSIIALFAGLSELNLRKTLILASISSLVWNAAIIYIGMIFGQNVKFVDKLLSTYSSILLVILCTAIIFYFTRYFILRRNRSNI